MVITNNDITNKNFKKLSIQVSLSGLSFCVFDLITHKIIAHNELPLNPNQVVEEQLWKAFTTFPVLSNPYDEIIVVHDNSINTFVPNAIFDENFLGSYLQYNVKVFETDLFSHDAITPYDFQNVYVPYVNINNFLLDQFETFEYCNANSILVKKMLEQTSNQTEKEVYIHVQKEHFEIIVLKNKELLLFNSFDYQTTEDFIYYVLFTFEQLQLNPETVPLFVLGLENENGALFQMAYKYIRHCSLLDVSKSASVFDVEESLIRKHFILFHS